MWRMTPRLATATLIATLALVLATIPEAHAASVQSYTYSTYGDIAGMAGVQPIELNGVYGSGTLTTPGAFVLGTFDAGTLPSTATLTYNNTPFTVDLSVYASGSNPYYYNSSSYQYQISGVLNGSITGNGISSMIASITSVTGSGSGTMTTPPFALSDLQVAPQGIAAPNGYIDGTTTLTAQVVIAGTTGPGLPAAAPEPSTIAIFGIALAGWAYRRRSRPRSGG